MTDNLKCNWRDGEQCQFEKYGLPVAIHEGRMACRAHAPLGAADAMAPDELAKFVDSVLRNGDDNLSGLHFGRSNAGWRLASRGDEKSLSLRYCTFDGAGAVRIEGAGRARSVSLSRRVCRTQYSGCGHFVARGQVHVSGDNLLLSRKSH